MTEPRILTDEERSELTRQFFGSDFYKLVFKPEQEMARQIIRMESRKAADQMDLSRVFAWEWYLRAIDDIEESWIGTQAVAAKLPDIEPPSYGAPKYPKVKNEE